MPKIGENIRAKVKDDKLILTIDLSKKGRTSKSGKSKVLASAGRSYNFDGDDWGKTLDGCRLNLNFFRLKGSGSKKRKSRRSKQASSDSSD